MQSAPGPETWIDGVRYLYFAGTSYLGLASDPEVIEAGCQAMRQYGVHSATSRAGCGSNPPVLEVEREAAAFFGTEDAFYFSSGYASNHIAVAALAPDLDAVLVDEAAHFCVREAARLAGRPVTTFRHRDPDDLARAVSAAGEGRVLVLADAVGPATGWTAPVDEYCRVLERCERAALLLDDAHGFGVLGSQGRGWLEARGRWPLVNQVPQERGLSLYVVGTLAKALGGFGGIIPGSRAWIERVRSASHYFDGASAPASAVAGATACALHLVRTQPERRERLRTNIRRLRDGLRGLGVALPPAETAQIGIQLGDAARMRQIHEALKARGVWVPYFGAYSGLPPEGVLRVAVFGTHTGAQIEVLLGHLKELS